MNVKVHTTGIYLTGLVAAVGIFTGCAVGPGAKDSPDTATPWVRQSVEYKAAALQSYQAAGDVLGELLNNADWSALPQQRRTSGLPAAIILDVDETVLDNSRYQQRHGGRYDPDTWDDWLAERAAAAVPGAVEFLGQARSAGVRTFFITNRPCRRRPGNNDPCPQQQDTLANMAALGIASDAEQLMLLGERPEWGREKQTRRDAVSKAFRVIMLFGDQLGDFLPCARSSIEPPCTQSATAESRLAMYAAHARYWGRGWYVLPNPMYGSWTGFD